MRAQNVFLIGPVGAGKSTIGRQLADRIKQDFYDSDKEIEDACGVDINWIFDVEGEEGFRQREKSTLHKLISSKQGIVLATGGGAISDSENRRLLSSRGKVIYLKASIEQQLERTSKNKERPLLQVDDREAQLIKLMNERECLYEEIADLSIETSESTVKKIVERIINLLEKDGELDDRGQS